MIIGSGKIFYALAAGFSFLVFLSVKIASGKPWSNPATVVLTIIFSLIAMGIGVSLADIYGVEDYVLKRGY